MKAVESGDTETAQRLVDEAAKAAGYDTEPLYHGTRRFGFTKVSCRTYRTGQAGCKNHWAQTGSLSKQV